MIGVAKGGKLMVAASLSSAPLIWVRSRTSFNE
jgi:hypothetical protein